MEDRAYLHALNTLDDLGPRRLTALIEHFGAARAAWEVAAGELCRVPGFTAELAERVAAQRREVTVERAWETVQKLGLQVIVRGEAKYPFLLSSLAVPPPILYLKGTLTAADRRSIAVVGSRNHTFYGRDVALKLGRELAAAQFTVVSGMARGIDSWAHRGALTAGGRTLAVLGCGLDICYPRENKKLMDEIAACGGLISEFPPGTAPLKQNFPQRNRIISGLSLGTVVVEASLKSGALITADFALEQGRDVFAVPGSVLGPYSRGCHRLLKEGARLVESVDDILEEYNCHLVGADAGERAPELEPDEQKVLALLSANPCTVDELQTGSGLSFPRINGLLLGLELKGLIRQVPGRQYMRIY